MSTEIYAVAGNPVIHSKSPDMFNSAFSKIGLDAHYIRFAAFESAEIFRVADEIGINGINITSPFKEEISKLIRVSAEAKKIGAVNTLVRTSEGFFGDNTDWIGVQDALLKNNIELKGKKAVVLGAGGAAKAAIYALVANQAKVFVVNRTFEKANVIAEVFGCTAMPTDSLSELLRDTDILISCIPTQETMVDPNALEKGMVVLDANYYENSTLISAAKEKGCKIIDPLEWLIYQALPAFKLFTGKNAPEQTMRQAAYSSRSSKPNISLIGFMGSGKTVTCTEISVRAGMELVDLDHEIEISTGMKINELFREKGEKAFRKLEKRQVAKIITVKNSVISCGGGTIIDPENASIINKISDVFWLWTDTSSTLGRLKHSNDRPLLNLPNDEERKKKLISILESRLPIYARTCDVLISSVGKAPVKIAERIIAEYAGKSEPALASPMLINYSEISEDVTAPSSKSMMVRAVAAALLCKGKTTIFNPSFCDDAIAALGIIKELGARVLEKEDCLEIDGIGNPYTRDYDETVLECLESGLSIRMFAPIVALQASKTTLNASGSLKKRPIVQIEKLNELGVECKTSGGHAPVIINGPIHAGNIGLDGSESSQFLTGLLMALPLCKQDSVLDVLNLKSKPYVEMTISLLAKFGISVSTEQMKKFRIKGKQSYKACEYYVEGDWSGAAFLLVAGAIAGKTKVKNLDPNSPQADRAILNALEKAGAKIKLGKDFVFVEKDELNAFDFDASECPDLFPPIVALASACKGTTRITGAERLKH
ncbi:shikimate dehydrogenase, partial [Candidatus Micrarchaeota archaeon]|nr:shikimate dehydrogenase [Candidatus Micrarchaeota archaeon]